MALKAIVEPENKYTIHVNGLTFENMKLVSEWEGYKKFEGASGIIILSGGPVTSFSDLFDELFNPTNINKQVFTFEKASQDVHDAFAKHKVELDKMGGKVEGEV